MKKHKAFLMGAIAMLFVISVFWAGNALAATCFTDIASLPTVFQEAICWMKDNAITSGYPDGTYKPNGTVTRAQMALFMKNQAEVPPSTGDVYISTGPTAWVVNANSPAGTIQHYAGFSWLGAPTTGTYRYSLSPSLPTSLYGTTMYAKGVKICYAASLVGAYITGIDLKHFAYSTTGYTYKNTYYDYTDLAGIGCYTLYFTTPSSLAGNDQITIDIQVTLTNASDYVRIGVTTLILSPSAEAAVLSVDTQELDGMEIPTINDGASEK